MAPMYESHQYSQYQEYGMIFVPFWTNKVTAKTLAIMHCRSCSMAPLQPVSYKCITARPPPGHTLATGISGLLPTTPDKHEYFATFTKLYIRMKIVNLIKTLSEAEHHSIATTAKVQRHFGKPTTRVRYENENLNLYTF